MKFTITICGDPVPKPRQSQRDRWKPSPSVIAYRKWADLARLSCRHEPTHWPLTPAPALVEIKIFHAIPARWSKKKQDAARGTPKLTRPDTSNILKAVEDALWPDEDSGLWNIRASKRYDDGNGPRVVVEITE